MSFLAVEQHLPADELYRRYRRADRPTEQTERIRSLTLYHWWPGGADHEPEP